MEGAEADKEHIAFSGYLSVWKLLGCVIFCVLIMLLFMFSDGSGNSARYRWLFEPWALPIRIALILVVAMGLIIFLRLLLTAVLNKPAIQVRDGVISIDAWKVGNFSISDIDELVDLTSGGGYYVRVKTRKYAISYAFSRDTKTLRQNIEKLRPVIMAVVADRPASQ